MAIDSPTLALLDALAAAHGLAPAPHRVIASAAVGPALGDFDDANALVDFDEPGLRARLERAVATAAATPPIAALADALAACCARSGPVALLADGTAARTALAHAAQQRRRGRVVAIGAAAAACAGIAAVEALAADALSGLDLDGVALLIVEPTLPIAALRDLAARARAAGCALAFEESRTAFRCAPTTVAATLPDTAGFVLLGPAIAAGLPCHAIVGLAAPPTIDAVTATVATCVLDTLRAAPIDAACQRAVATIRSALDAAAATHDLRLVWNGSAALPSLAFAGQEGAPGELIGHHFALELQALGVHLRGPLLVPARVRRDEARAAAAAFAHAALRLRVLLVEYNSHLSGGLAWPFAGGAPLLRARGLARYRFPRLGEVDVDVRGDAVRIAFAAGELGAITSSGFYVPTRLCGDVQLTVRYVLRDWRSGPDSACLGLFLQNEPSTARYYAQLISTADAPQRLRAAAGYGGQLFGQRHAPSGAGWLRLRRCAGLVTAWHRDAAEADFVELGTTDAVGDDLYAGAKIWSKVRTDGLVADLYDLAIEALVPDDQPPPLPARPDPRGER